MSADSTGESSDLVRTYVPSYQKQIWEEDAEYLGMSLSEYVRTMVQAGRRDFLPEPEPNSNPVTPRSNALETIILDILEREPQSRDELLAEAAQDMEQRIIDTIVELSEADRIRFDARLNKLVLLEDA